MNAEPQFQTRPADIIAPRAGSTPDTGEAATAQKNIRHVLARDPRRSNARDIFSAADWQDKRADLRATLSELMGFSLSAIAPPPQFRVLEEEQQTDFRRYKISYFVDSDEEVRAHLLIPPIEKRRVNARAQSAAVLCLHGTAREAKDTQLGAGKPGRDYARLLSSHGFITLSPDSICAGERLQNGYEPYDTTPFYARHPHWSAVGKAVWDGARALDILQTIPQVDATRLGCVGHSLGGYSTLWLAAFDERVRCAISNCGLTTWQENPDRYHWSRQSWYVHFPELRAIFEDQEKRGGLLPVEMHEFAALIAPRAFLNISGMADEMYGNNETLPAVGLQLSELWQLLGAPEKFANFLPGSGHAVPSYSRALTLEWLRYWLRDTAK